MSRIPITEARLQPFISILVPGDGGKEVGVGSINKISWDSERDVNVWRQLNADDTDPGIAQEVYPSALPKYTLKVSKIVLYKQTFMHAFGLTSSGKGYDILGQLRPVDIKVQLYEPSLASDIATVNQNTAVDNKSVSVTIIFKGVWFKNLPMSFDVDATDLKIEQEVEGMASRIEVS